MDHLSEPDEQPVSLFPLGTLALRVCLSLCAGAVPVGRSLSVPVGPCPFSAVDH